MKSNLHLANKNFTYFSSNKLLFAQVLKRVHSHLPEGNIAMINLRVAKYSLIQTAIQGFGVGLGVFKHRDQNGLNESPIL